MTKELYKIVKEVKSRTYVGIGLEESTDRSMKTHLVIVICLVTRAVVCNPIYMLINDTP